MLEIRGLTKIYENKVVAVDDISFEVRNGEIVGFVGLNGAGKTTTIKVSCGVLLPTRGTVFVDGLDITKEKIEASKRVAWLPEIPIFDPNAKPIPLLKYFAGFYGITGSKAEAIAIELLKKVGLEEHFNKKLGKYSQGMRKRFALAASMISDPPNYLFDEVLNGLDPSGIHFFKSLAFEFKKQNKAVLFSSHILSEVENLADRVVIIHKGKIIKILSASDLRTSGKKVLRIEFKKLDNNLLDFLKSYGEVEVEGNLVIVSGFEGEPAELNLELSKRGYMINSLEYRKTSLEEYFLKLIGEA